MCKFNSIVFIYRKEDIMSRKFEYVNRVTSTGCEMKNPGFNLPKRATKYSAGYDFECPERVEIPPYKLGDNPILVKTGVKAYMLDDEYLMLVNRSSNPKKKKLVIPNSIGIVDAK
jgi:dUTP pyrophosphatase